jgi:F0F1-type ATP synthase membrane subunit c/vacuolar-type H+-ATPase subunit K
MTEWLGDNAWWLLAAGIAVPLCGMGVMVAWAIVMPADHFIRPYRRAERAAGHFMWHMVLRVLRNVAGVILLVAGMILAIPMVPGPGVLLIILGLSLTDIPGKRALGRRIVRSPMVLRPINALRARWKRPPLQLPHDNRK